MARLSELTDVYYEEPIPQARPLPVDIPRVVISSNVGTDNIVRPTPDYVNPPVNNPIDKLTGATGERYQLWPEKIIRGGLEAAGKVMSGEVPQWSIDKDTGDVHTSPQMIEKAQEISALAGSGGIGGTGPNVANRAGADVRLFGKRIGKGSDEAMGEVPAIAFGATPSLRPALRYKDKLYKGKEGQQHLDVIPENLYPDFQKKAMSGQDINEYNFGFINDKGQFLTREKALEYGINTGIIDPAAGKYGALTSTLMADSSKPGTAIEAVAKTTPTFYSAVEHNINAIPQAKMTGDQWLGTLSNKPGVKPEEMQWTGLADFLAENKGKPVTKEAIQEHLAANKVELKEVSKGASEYHKLQYKPTLENNLRMFDSILPSFKTVEDVALAKHHNPQFRETVKGKSDQEIFDAVQKAKVSEDYPSNLFRNYDTVAEAEAARRAAGADAHLEVRSERKNSDTKYHSYQLPGGENYREVLMTLPDKQQRIYEYEYFDPKTQTSKQFKTEAEAKAAAPEGAVVIPKEVAEINPAYRSSHWDEPNILAHVRMNDRTIDGKKSLHVEEIQSDWHQQGRDKGYQNPMPKKDIPAAIEKLHSIEKEMDTLYKQGKHELDPNAEVMQVHPEYKKLEDEKRILLRRIRPDSSEVPDAPFKKTWHELALKRMLREAAEKGYDRLSWTPGEAQAARYDLSKSVDKIAVPMVSNSGFSRSVRIDGKDGTSYKLMVDANGKVEGQLSAGQFTGKKLDEVVGKEMADKIMKLDKPNEFSGDGLKIGGEGMKGFYDQMIPKALEKLGKEHGIKVKSTNVETIKPTPLKNGKWQVEKDADVYTFKSEEGAKAWINKNSPAPVFYIDLPQSLKDQALQKGFPLFSKGGFMLQPVDYEPEFNK